jgi:CRP-like cAMP-binding protein
MIEELKKLFKTLAPFEEEELDEVEHLYEIRTFEKNAYFSRAGLISDHIGFVSKGLLRAFYTIKDKETTSFFLTPGAVAAALLSFIKQQPAIENIQALETSEMLVISRKDLHKLYENNWKWQQVGRVLIENYYVNMEQRTITLQSQTAQERYAQFLKDYPEIIQKVPLHYIASYLGMSPETLSRVRKTI